MKLACPMINKKNKKQIKGWLFRPTPKAASGGNKFYSPYHSRKCGHRKICLHDTTRSEANWIIHQLVGCHHPITYDYFVSDTWSPKKTFKPILLSCSGPPAKRNRTTENNALPSSPNSIQLSQKATLEGRALVPGYPQSAPHLHWENGSLSVWKEHWRL